MVRPACRTRTSPPDNGVPDTLSATVPLMSPSTGGAEVAEGGVRGVDARAGTGGVRLDVRRGVRAGAVELGVRPRGGARQRELEQRRQQPERTHSAHATVTFRTTHAATSSSPYIQTISGPVGRSALYDTHRPSDEASAPEAHEMYVSRRMSRVNRNAITAGTTRKLNTIRTPATGTASVMTTPKDR